MSDRIKLRLGDTSAYMYRSFKIQSARRRKPRWRCCVCCARADPPPTAAAAAAAADAGAVPRHAVALYVDAPEVDDSWAVVLTAAKLQVMRTEGKTSIHVFSRHHNTPVFRARLSPPPRVHLHRAAATAIPDEWTMVRDDAVQEVLKLCIMNGQPADAAIKLPNDRKYLLRSVPVWDDRDVLVGVLWSARPAEVDAPTPLSTDHQRRAAVYYDATSKIFVLNETWLRHRSLVGDALESTDGGGAVLMTNPAGEVETIRNIEAAGKLVVRRCDATTAPTPCKLNRLVLPAVAAQIDDTMRRLSDNGLTTGQITNGVTGGDLGSKGYTVTITKVVSGLGQKLAGFVVVITETDTLGHLVTAARSPPRSPPRGSPRGGSPPDRRH